MFVGCVKEIKNQEYRVGLIPAHVKSFIDHNHTVYIEKDAGVGSGLPMKIMSTMERLF